LCVAAGLETETVTTLNSQYFPTQHQVIRRLKKENCFCCIYI